MDNLQNNTKAIEDKLSFFLRLFGALIIISAAVGFAIKDWDQLLSWQKCGLFLLADVIIAAIAWVCKFWFKDQKGSGALFAVAASMIPVHVSQLGGFIMNSFGFEKANYAFTDIFHWQAESPFTSVTLTILGLIIFYLITQAAFSTLLSKDQASPTTKLFLATNVALLLPFRSAWFVLPTAIALFMIILFNDRKIFKSQREIGTIIVRILMFVAPIIMLSRMYYIYNHTAIIIGISLLLFSFTFFIAANYLHENSKIVLTIQSISIINALIGWLVISIDILNKFRSNHELLIIGIPMSILLILGGRFAVKRLDVCYNIAILIALIVQTFELIFYNSCFSATFVTILSVFIFSYCIINHDFTYAFFSAILAITGICKDYGIAMREDKYWLWFVIGFAGVVIVLIPSIPRKFLMFLKRDDEMLQDTARADIEDKAFTNLNKKQSEASLNSDKED